MHIFCVGESSFHLVYIMGRVDVRKLENSTDVSNLSFLIILTVEMVETTTDLLAFIMLSLNRIYYP